MGYEIIKMSDGNDDGSAKGNGVCSDGLCTNIILCNLNVFCSSSDTLCIEPYCNSNPGCVECMCDFDIGCDPFGMEGTGNKLRLR